MISVIVTVYNKSDCLKRCIDSILNQTLKAIDLILVDDGSVDESGKIIDDYNALDSRVQAIHKSNGGESSARKEGLKHAKGDYVLFVDADDWIEIDALDYLSEKANENKADVVTGDWIIHYGQKESIDAGYMPEGVYHEEKGKQSFIKRMIYYNEVTCNGLNASLNTKLFRVDLISGILEELPNGIVYAEDDFVTYIALVLANCVVVTHNPFYHYVMNAASISHSLNEWYLRDLNQGYLYFKRMVKDSLHRDECMKQIEIYMQRAVYYGMSKYLGFSTDSSISWYQFDEDNLPQGDRIVIYGAGKVGQCYYQQLNNSLDYEVVLWVDRQYELYKEKGYLVESPEVLNTVQYDKVILAVADKNLADDISNSLVRDLNIDMNKILWSEPINIIDERLSQMLHV